VTARHSHDLTPLVDLTGEKGAGPIRTQRPAWVDQLPPCNDACPAGENIQEWLGLAQAGRYRDAWLALTEDNPLPAVHGRVCYHPCESSCNRTQLDSAVGIHAVERFLGDLALAEGWTFPTAAPTGKRVLVVGAGPCGLAAAYHLARRGHAVQIRDAGPLPGGMLHFGIPAYRLPREELMREIARIEAMGVRILTDHAVTDVRAEQRAGGFDAVLVAIGAQIERRVEIPAVDASRVLNALELLRAVDQDAAPRLGRRVVIYGGGNTAVDAARSARRLGATEPLIVYRRDRAHMGAHDAELRAALDEGITVRWLSTIRSIGAGELFVERMELDAKGFPQPTGEVERLDADTVVLALGEQADTRFLAATPGIEVRADGSVVVGDDLMTGADGIFAGGDVTPGSRSVTTATGHGKRAARAIDAWLRGKQLPNKPYRAPIGFELLRLPISTDAAARQEPEVPAEARLGGFGEVVAGLGPREARYEAQRCLSCGNCYECDQCFAACPEHAIAKLGPGKGYLLDTGLCTGCRACFEQCPCGAIEMIAEPV